MADSPVTLDNAKRIVAWFSCGTSSATATLLTINRLARRSSDDYRLVVARCVVPEEHPDNERFCAECEIWFGRRILDLSSNLYDSCEDVWRRTRYMAGPGGARCSVEMKKAARWAFERAFNPDLHVFGYTAEEKARAERFRQNNPEINLCTPLIDAGLTKANCHAFVDHAGIMLPEMYRLGFSNANCIGCVMAQSPKYWNRVRRLFPEVFAARVALSRDIGARLVRGTRQPRPHLFLDELDPALDDDDPDPPMECGPFCMTAIQETG